MNTGNCVCICSKSSAERGLHRYWQEERTHAVDIALINLCKRGDIVVTQDYGVAALALGKGARAIHQSGKWYTDDNIDGLLMERESQAQRKTSPERPREAHRRR